MIIEIPRTFKEFLTFVEKHGDAVALCDHKQHQELSYSDLIKRAKDIANRLSITKGQRVVLYDINQIDWVISFFAIQLCDGIAVPVDERTSELFFQNVLSSTEPSLIITGNSKIKEQTKIPVMSFAELSNNSALNTLDIKSEPDRPCEIIFTSGTWSEPKGVVLSQQNLLANVEHILSVYPYSKPSVDLGVLPLSHAYQQTLGLLVPLTMGSKIVFLKVSNSFDLLEAIKAHHVVLIPLIPRVLELLRSAILRKIKNLYIRKMFSLFVALSRHLPRAVRRILFSRIHTQIGSSLRILVSGGSPLNQDLDHFFQGLGYQVFVGYGLSECSPIISASFSANRVIGEVGRPLPMVDVTLSETNELVVRGENIFLGYWPDCGGQPEVRTGDIARMTPSGNIIIKGRNKNLIIFDNGEKCFCEDLERMIDSLDEIEASCVVERRVSGEVRAECLAVQSQNQSIDAEKIIKYVNAKLPFGIKLSRVMFVQSVDFPRTHTLKPNRAKVLALLDYE